uniref:SCP domain-containing protein n=1 Tax=Strongyloides stercoralis TaxID=6248 RepID=A0A0K0E6K0_STRER
MMDAIKAFLAKSGYSLSTSTNKNTNHNTNHNANQNTNQNINQNTNQGTTSLSTEISNRIWTNYYYEDDTRNNFYDMKRRMYLQTNDYRSLHGVPKLEINETLAYEAQQYANKLADIDQLVHDKKNRENDWGENLAMGSPTIANFAVKWWYDEIKDYDFNNHGFKSGIGHFTQLIWKDSKQVGCGVASNGNHVYVVCKYYPAGNYMGEFEDNVPKPIHQ